MPYEEILYAAKGPVGYLTLNNPEKINALSKNMIGEIIHVLGQIAEDESIKVLILSGAGQHFCAGHNLVAMTHSGPDR